MDLDNIKYLRSIADRVEYYCLTRKKAERYIQVNDIKDKKLIVGLVLTSAIWAAHQRKELVTEDDLLALLGLRKEEGDNDFNMNILRLDESHQELTLFEILEQTVEGFKQ